MIQQVNIGTIFGREFRLHWSLPILTSAVAVYSLATRSWQQAAFFVALLICSYLMVIIHEAGIYLIATMLGLTVRNTTVYPFCAVSRCAQMSDRPHQEKTLAIAAIAVRALVAALIAAGITMSGHRVAFPRDLTEPTMEAFSAFLFASAVLLVVLHLLPLLPLDGGQWFRAVLAQRTSRIRGTEIAAMVSTVGVGIIIFAAIVWMSSPFLAVVGLLIFLAAQDELDVTRRFEKLRTNLDRPAASPTMLVPVHDIVTPESRPREPDFSGFTWSPQSRLWIEWKDGQPIAANAVLGDRGP